MLNKDDDELSFNDLKLSLSDDVDSPSDILSFNNVEFSSSDGVISALASACTCIMSALEFSAEILTEPFLGPSAGKVELSLIYRELFDDSAAWLSIIFVWDIASLFGFLTPTGFPAALL